MDEKELIRSIYKQMYEGMISKDETLLREVLDDSFVLVHMTGMQQSKKEFIKAVLNGTLNYFSVFGGGKHTWRLQQKCDLKKANGKWKITRSVVSTY